MNRLSKIYPHRVFIRYDYLYRSTKRVVPLTSNVIGNNMVNINYVDPLNESVSSTERKARVNKKNT